MELQEFNTKYQLGLYVAGHIDKEEFLEALLKHPRVIQYIESWEPLDIEITIDCIDYCWNIYKGHKPIIFEEVLRDFPYIEKDWEPITFYEFWTVV